MILKNIASAAVAAIVAALVSLGVANSAAPSLGGSVETDLNEFAAGIKVGDGGTQVSKLVFGTCSLVGNPTVATNTPAAMDCAASAAKSGDKVVVTSPEAITAGWSLSDARASTTAGYITVTVRNDTGASGIPPATATSTLSYVLVR